MRRLRETVKQEICGMFSSSLIDFMSYLCKYVTNVNCTIIQGIVPKSEFKVFVFLVGDVHSTIHNTIDGFIFVEPDIIWSVKQFLYHYMMFNLIMSMFSIDCSTACLCVWLMIIYSLGTKPGCCLSVCRWVSVWHVECTQSIKRYIQSRLSGAVLLCLLQSPLQMSLFLFRKPYT